MTHNCCSKGRCQPLWFWVCSFGEKHFLNHIKLNINTETHEVKLQNLQGYGLNPAGVCCTVTEIPLICCLGFYSFSPLIPYLPFLLSYSKVLHTEQFLSFLPPTFNDQVLGNNCFRTFISPEVSLSHTLPFSHLPKYAYTVIPSGTSLDWN